MKLAEIHDLPGIAWSSKAAAGDALQRVGMDSPFLALWMDAEGRWYWAKANTDFASLSQMAALTAEFAQSCAREALNGQG